MRNAGFLPRGSPDQFQALPDRRSDWAAALTFEVDVEPAHALDGRLGEQHDGLTLRLFDQLDLDEHAWLEPEPGVLDLDGRSLHLLHHTDFMVILIHQNDIFGWCMRGGCLHDLGHDVEVVSNEGTEEHAVLRSIGNPNSLLKNTRRVCSANLLKKGMVVAVRQIDAKF